MDADATPAGSKTVPVGGESVRGDERVRVDAEAVPAGAGSEALRVGGVAADREGAVSGGTWLVLSDEDDALAAATAAGLEERGKTVVRHRVTNRPPEDHPAMDEPVDGVVLVPSADLVDEELVLAVVGVSRSLPDGPRLYVATRNALALNGEEGLPGHGFVSALTRVLAFERTVQRATHVDVDRPADLVAELLPMGTFARSPGGAGRGMWRGSDRRPCRRRRRRRSGSSGAAARTSSPAGTAGSVSLPRGCWRNAVPNASSCPDGAGPTPMPRR